MSGLIIFGTDKIQNPAETRFINDKRHHYWCPFTGTVSLSSPVYRTWLSVARKSHKSPKGTKILLTIAAMKLIIFLLGIKNVLHAKP